MKKILLLLCITFYVLRSALYVYAGPQSTNYEIVEYGFGSGGTSGTDSTNYTIFGTLGETDASKLDSTTYSVKGGLVFTMQANVPPAPTFSNPSNYYNRLQLILNQGNNPSDSTYAIAISTDNFATDTRYIQDDNTIGVTLGAEDWQSYTAWGGASGFYVIGLQPNTTYTVKVAAEQGNFTQTGYGPTAQAATSNVTLSFDIDVSASNSETNAPYTISLGNLSAGSVTTASEYIWLDLATNAEYGGFVYLYDTYTGLRSSTANYTISSTTTDLAAAQEGYGLRVNTTTNLTAAAPYNGASDNVGIVDTTIREVFHSGNAPVTGGRGSLAVKAKVSTTTPASNDYEDTITLISTASY